jgi:hypothetical protein
MANDAPLFALFRPESIMFTKLEKKQDALMFDERTGWVARRGPGSRVEYEAQSIMDPQTPDALERRQNVSFPSQSIATLAAGLLRASRYEPDPAKRPIEDDAAAARVFEMYLRTNYVYALDVGPAPGNVMPTEWFLFTTRRGHCEYFASALAAMCRSVGIDARVVAGYLATECDPVTKIYTVRASDAHAWVEVNTGPGGWQHRDATPVQGLQDLQDSRHSLRSRLGRLVDAIQNMWNTKVVAFDQTAQDRILGQPAVGRNFLERLVDLLRDRTIGLRKLAHSQRQAAGAAMEVGAGLLVVGMAWVAWRAWRRRAAATEGEPGWAMSGAERRTYLELIKVLAARGYPKPVWMPPVAHLRAVAARDPGFAGRAERIVALLYRARFGGGGREAVRAAARGVSELRRSATSA